MEENKQISISPVLPREAKRVLRALAVFLVFAALFMFVKFIGEAKSLKFIGGGVTPTSTISVNGTGEAFAVPDIAVLSVTIHEEAPTLSASQTKAGDKEKAVLAYLKGQGIDEKDIKTEYFNSSEKYEWQAGAAMPCAITYCPPNPGKNVKVGFQTDETLSVKIRKTDNVSTIVDGVGKIGVASIGSPNYTVDDENVVQDEARTKAIDDAKAKAAELAKELGVTIVRITNFSDSNGGTPGPYYMAKDMAVSSAGSAPSAPELPKGENKYTSNVTITYEIR